MSRQRMGRQGASTHGHSVVHAEMASCTTQHVGTYSSVQALPPLTCHFYPPTCHLQVAEFTRLYIQSTRGATGKPANVKEV
jgi:hypothetical protein